MKKAEKNYLESIRLLGEQVKQSFKEAGQIKLPKTYRSINRIVTCGMGGSQLPVDLVSNLFGQEIKSSISQVRDYNLPKFVDSKTLVFLLSYSGSTEEVLSAGKQAKKLKCKVVVITSGGQLATMAKRNNWPLYKFDPINNPSGQPRMGTGYFIGSILAVLKKIGKIKISATQINQFRKSTEDNYK